MKKTIGAISLIASLLPSIASAFVYPCDGVPGTYHTNPDSSVGDLFQVLQLLMLQ